MKMISLVVVLSSVFAFGGQDPDELAVKVYRAYFSENSDCSDAKLIFRESNPEWRNILVNPTFANVDNSVGFLDGIFPCVILEISDTLYFSPLFDEGSCEPDERYTSDICLSGHVTQDPVGNQITCSTDVDDRVYLYLSTASTTETTGANAFLPPDGNLSYGVQLPSPIFVGGTRTVVFVVDASNKVVHSNGECLLQAPDFSFRSS